jgi:hypothetical protein
MAQGNDPRPPASHAATAIADPVDPAMGACMIGMSIPNKSSKRRFGHIALSLLQDQLRPILEQWKEPWNI